MVSSQYNICKLFVIGITVPIPRNISVVPHNVQTVGQSLLLECIVTTVRGISSAIDITWSSDDLVFQSERNVSINFTTLYTVSYTSTYIIPQLSTVDDGKVYSCKVVINTTPLVIVAGRIELDIIGNIISFCMLMTYLSNQQCTYICTYVLSYLFSNIHVHTYIIAQVTLCLYVQCCCI